MAFYTRGDRNFGVDFRGGDLVTMSAPDKIDIGQVRDALKPIGLWRRINSGVRRRAARVTSPSARR